MRDDNGKREQPPQLAAAPNKGRPPGSQNKFSRDLKECMLQAAILSDDALDHETGLRSLTRYLLATQRKFPLQYFSAIAKLVPHEIRSQSLSQSSIEVVYRSVEDVKLALLQSGLTQKEVDALSAALPRGDVLEIEVDDEETKQ
jgi:hypothetical protein